MRVAIISDTHLTDQFEEEKFEYLKKIIQNNDRIIINGDLWEGQLISFQDFLNSEWSKLFLLLEKKDVVYIHGNHDKPSMMDQKKIPFTDVVRDSYEITLENPRRVLHITHGDQFVSYPFTYLRTHPAFLSVVRPANRIRMRAENWLGGQIGWKKAEIFTIEKNYEKFIDIAKNQYSGKILVASHFHYPVFEPEKHYINTGMILFHLASYIQIDNGNMRLIKETY